MAPFPIQSDAAASVWIIAALSGFFALIQSRDGPDR
jgi:hypothetical protein